MLKQLDNTCPRYVNKGDHIMSKFARDKIEINLFEQKLENMTSNNVIFQPSQSKTDVCFQVLTIFEETKKKLSVICNLKDNIKKIDRSGKNTKLQVLLAKYEKICSFLTRAYSVEEAHNLNRYMKEEKKIRRKKNLTSAYEVLDFLKAYSMSQNRLSSIYTTDVKKLIETEILKMFFEERPIDSRDEEMNVYKLLRQTVDIPGTFTGGFRKILNYMSSALPQKDTIKTRAYHRINALRYSFNLNDNHLRNICKNIMREIKKENYSNSSLHSEVPNKNPPIIKQFRTFIEIYSRKLEKHPIQYFIEKLYLEYVQDRTKNYAALAEILENTRKEVSEINISKKNKFDEELKALRLQISLNEEVSKEVLANSKQVEELEETKKKTKLYIQAKKDIPSLGITENWNHEVQIRKTKYSLRSVAKSTMCAIEEKIIATDNAIVAILKEYKTGLQQKLGATQRLFEDRKLVFEEILWRREMLRRHSASEQIMIRRRWTAAIKIQVWWRSMAAKRQCDNIKKMAQKSSKPLHLLKSFISQQLKPSHHKGLDT